MRSLYTRQGAIIVHQTRCDHCTPDKVRSLYTSLHTAYALIACGFTVTVVVDWKPSTEVVDWKPSTEVVDWKPSTEVVDWKPSTEVSTHKCFDWTLVQWQNMAVCIYKNMKIAISQDPQKFQPVKIKAQYIEPWLQLFGWVTTWLQVFGWVTTWLQVFGWVTTWVYFKWSLVAKEQLREYIDNGIGVGTGNKGGEVCTVSVVQ